ncbi:hypothetical protein GALMADRAFT_138297 [Galerina marginata CBS 339.88]|uniref:Uncharacterized protein n=1 Tax=Galerina marginata (strain CBS 339.88) TaxID=685588 RepID=A0A067T4P7_GALM3|nr:hypothetical protein GALMADRAFT_138297 [Galerina marginata CBS 339.88]
MYTPLHLLADVCFQQVPMPTPSMPSSSAPPDHGNAVRFRELSLPPIITLNCARDNGDNRPTDFSQRTTLIHLSDLKHVTEPPLNVPERSISTTARTQGKKRKREGAAVQSCQEATSSLSDVTGPPKNKRQKKTYDTSDRVLRSRKSEMPPQTENEETIQTPEQKIEGPSVPLMVDAHVHTEPSSSESASSDVPTYLPFSGVLGYRRLNAPEDDPWTMTQAEVVAVINKFKDTQSWGEIRRPLVL